MIRRFLRVLGVGLLGACVSMSSVAFAAESAKGPVELAAATQRRTPTTRSSGSRSSSKVDVRVTVVYATSAHKKVDPRLGQLTQYLSHLRYTGYEVLNTYSAQVGTNDTESFSIEGNRKVSVTVLSRDDQRVRLRVQMVGSRGKLLDTTLSVNRNGTFIVAGPRYKEGILVLPLTARY